MNDVQATGEAFSPQKRTSNTIKHEISKIFAILRVFLALLDPEPDSESGSTDLIESGSGSETLLFFFYLKLFHSSYSSVGTIVPHRTVRSTLP
jgi:hypothetical protein